ncbi:3-methyl-2-oxobutanoate hydroxymethyltransferase [Phytophthora ramorum]|uniref:3-methyl-2-oxobutanoate hydroxymethyltransferase n=1 Tax=Phytophthora ramorum TaxID=164328 RepID=UPI0030A3C789|nr:3-methyl-2-oxobutanoate hydroxymethyltransferase [Phytophthora ramorum]
MVEKDMDTTLPVTLEDMIHHTQSVKRGANRPLRLVKEGGADCVQVDGGKERAETRHMGLRPQHTTALGGFRAQGRTRSEVHRRRVRCAEAKAGVVLECVHYHYGAVHGLELLADAQTKAQMKSQQTSANAATESANDYCGTPTPAPTKPIVYIAPTITEKEYKHCL